MTTPSLRFMHCLPPTTEVSGSATATASPSSSRTRPTFYTEQQGLPYGRVDSLAQTPDGAIWAAVMSAGGLGSLSHNGRWERSNSTGTIRPIQLERCSSMAPARSWVTGGRIHSLPSSWKPNIPARPRSRSALGLKSAQGQTARCGSLIRSLRCFSISGNLRRKAISR